MLLIMLIAAPMQTYAQVQKGCVKTRGRMVNGRHVSGKGLPGAIVSIKNQMDVGVRKANGTFSFPVTDGHYFVDSVTMKNYILVDADAVPKTYAYTTDTLFFVMDTPERKMQDKLEAERNIRRTLQRQLQNREDEIEKLKTANKISQQEYQQALEKLFEEQEKNEKLISEMAKRYSELDYDQLDEFYRQVAYYVEQGDLVKADSILRSRGDVKSQISTQLIKGKTIRLKEDELQKAKEVHFYENSELARRCYSLYELFKLQHQNDSSAYYIELRALIDTTNVQWQFDAGYLGRFSNCEVYYSRVLKATEKKKGIRDIYLYATAMNNLGAYYQSKGDIERAEQAYKEGLEGRRLYAQVSRNRSDLNHVGWVLVNLGSLYLNQGRYVEAEQYLEEAKDIYRLIAYAYYSRWTKHAYGRLYNQLGRLYLDTDMLTDSKTYYLKSWNEYTGIVKDNPEEFLVTMSEILKWGIRPLYDKLNKLLECECYYCELDSLYNLFYPQNKRVKENYISFLDEETDFYGKMSKWDKALKIKEKQLELLTVEAKMSDVERISVASIQVNIAWLKMKQGKNPEAILLLKEVEQTLRKIAKQNPEDEYWYLYSVILLSECYRQNDEYQTAYEILDGLLSYVKGKYEEDTTKYSWYYAAVLNDLAFNCVFLSEFYKAEQFVREGIKVDSSINVLHTNLALSLLLQGKYSDAVLLYQRYKSEFKENFLEVFKCLEDKNVIPEERMKDVELIKQMLNE